MSYANAQTVVDSPKVADNFLIIDVSNLAYRSLHAYNLTTKDGRLSGHVYGSVRLLLSTLGTNLYPGKWCLVFCYDGKNSKKDRLEIMPEYKGGRVKKFNPMPEVADVIQHIPGLHVELKNREGDDGMVWIANALTKKAGGKAVLLTGDQDLWSMLSNPDVSIYSPNKKRFITKKDIQEKYHVENPEKVYLAKAFFGDPSDNIKGIERLTKKKFAKYLNDESLNTPADIYQKLEEEDFDGWSVKARFKLEDGKSRIVTNFKVVRPMIQGFSKEAVKRVKSKKEGKELLKEKLLSFECKNLVNQIGPLFGTPRYVKDNKEEK